MNIETITIPNFISEKEIVIIEEISKSYLESKFPDYDYGTLLKAWYEYFTPAGNQEILKILLPKLQKYLHHDIIINDLHILTSYYPYIIHSDVLSGVDQNFDNALPAWTIIIPLNNYNSKTIIFNEESPTTKDPYVWLVDKTPKDNKNKEFFKEYLDHNSIKLADYLTVHEIFDWRKGYLNATSRSKFHSSDNFRKNGIEEKRAIVMWSTLPFIK